jgi:hypothetical protein
MVLSFSPGMRRGEGGLSGLRVRVVRFSHLSALILEWLNSHVSSACTGFFGHLATQTAAVYRHRELRTQHCGAKASDQSIRPHYVGLVWKDETQIDEAGLYEVFAGRKSRWKAYIVACLPPPPPPLSAFAARCVAAAALPLPSCLGRCTAADGRVRCMTAVKEACWNRGTRYDERWQISRSPKTGVLAYGVKRVRETETLWTERDLYNV